MWKERQRALNDGGAALPLDGVPGPSTVAALKAADHDVGVRALR